MNNDDFATCISKFNRGANIDCFDGQYEEREVELVNIIDFVEGIK